MRHRRAGYGFARRNYQVHVNWERQKARLERRVGNRLKGENERVRGWGGENGQLVFSVNSEQCIGPLGTFLLSHFISLASPLSSAFPPLLH